MEKDVAEGQIFDRELGDSIKDEFLALYKRMGEVLRLESDVARKINSSHFEEFLKVLHNEGVTIKANAAVEAFRSLLVSNLSRNFNRMWESQSMTENISLLDFLKKKYANRTKPQWRPYGKSALEQTLPLRVRMFEKKSAYLDKQLAFQKEQLENAVVRVEESRKFLESVEHRRSRLSYNMDVRLETFAKIREQLIDLQLKSFQMRFA